MTEKMVVGGKNPDHRDRRIAVGIFGESKKELREKLHAAEQEVATAEQEAAKEKERFNHWYQTYQGDRIAETSSHHRNQARNDKRRST